MANPFPFVAGAVLEASQLNGIGEATAYTPTFTGLTVGNGTVNFKFVQIQKLVYVQGQLTFGSTTSISGGVSISFPVTAATQLTSTPTGTVSLLDAGIVRLFGAATFNSTTAFNITVFNSSGTNITSGAINATTPFTWTTTDVISVQLVYEAA